jgi:hypothetical protein
MKKKEKDKIQNEADRIVSGATQFVSLHELQIKPHRNDHYHPFYFSVGGNFVQQKGTC